jgi:uncharacterized protein (TIGR02117 family)
MLGGCTLWRREASPPAEGRFGHIVYVAKRGYHTDIGFAVGDLSGPLATVAARFPQAKTILVGFGDKTFVMTRRRWIGDWLLALLPGRGAMLVTGLRTTPPIALGAGDVVRLTLDEAQFEGVEGFVNRSFALSQGAPVWIGDGPYRGSLFYASARTYDLLDTCNTWTSAALRSGGLDVPVAFTLFSGQTIRSARGLAHDPVP